METNGSYEPGLYQAPGVRQPRFHLQEGPKRRTCWVLANPGHPQAQRPHILEYLGLKTRISNPGISFWKYFGCCWQGTGITFLGFKVWPPIWAPAPSSFYYWGLKCGHLVCNRNIRIPNWGSVLRAHGLNCKELPEFTYHLLYPSHGKLR